MEGSIETGGEGLEIVEGEEVTTAGANRDRGDRHAARDQGTDVGLGDVQGLGHVAGGVDGVGVGVARVLGIASPLA